VPVTHNFLAFNRSVTQPLGILPRFLVTLGGKIVFIDVMVFHDLLDFNFLCLCYEGCCVHSLLIDVFPSQWKHGDHKTTLIHWPSYDSQPSELP
jgi:hypothetical protein